MFGKWHRQLDRCASVNLIFLYTQLGSTDEASEIYLRPEQHRGIFVNFRNVQKTGGMKIPFGIAQVGKAFP